MALANLDNDKFFVSLVRDGILSVFENGKIFNNLTKNWIGSKSSNKYIKISFKDKTNNKIKHIQVHRLIYSIYHGEISDSNIEINHIDANKFNNHFSNLEMTTPSENINHAKKMGLLKIQAGELNGNSIFSDVEVIKMRNLYGIEMKTIKEISQQFKTSKAHVKTLVYGYSYKHLPLITRASNKCKGIRLPDDKINEIIELHKTGLSTYKISPIVNVHRSSIERIVSIYKKSLTIPVEVTTL